jgi:VWFA-related protein
MSKRTLFQVILLGIMLAVPGTASAQAASPSTGSSAMILNVVVAGKSGAPIADLQPGDFKLFDNKQAVNALSVQAAGGAGETDPPVEALLLLDSVNLDFTTVANERKQLIGFLRKNGGQLALPTALILLTDSGAQMPALPTRDGNALAAHLKEDETGLPTFARNTGAYSAEARWQVSLRSLNLILSAESKRPGRKLLLWLSTGWPAFSQMTARNTSQNQERLFNSIAALSTGMRRAGITLYSIDPTGAGQEQVALEKAPESLTERRGGSRMPTMESGTGKLYYQDFLKGVETPKDADYGNLLLGVLATQSGGQVFYGNNDLPWMITKCIADASGYYVITFNLPAAARANEYHSIEVQVDKPGLTARTRTGYYAQP